MRGAALFRRPFRGSASIARSRGRSRRASARARRKVPVKTASEPNERSHEDYASSISPALFTLITRAPTRVSSSWVMVGPCGQQISARAAMPSRNCACRMLPPPPLSLSPDYVGSALTDFLERRRRSSARDAHSGARARALIHSRARSIDASRSDSRGERTSSRERERISCFARVLGRETGLYYEFGVNRICMRDYRAHWRDADARIKEPDVCLTGVVRAKRQTGRPGREWRA